MKDFLKYCLTLVLILGITIAAFSIGANMASGKSAYEIAVEQGYDGTVDEWLTSLKGSDGQDAPALKSLYNNAVEQGFSGDIYDFVESELNIDNAEKYIYGANKGLVSVVSVNCQFTSTDMLASQFMGAGSGVLYDMDKEEGDAYVITNYHVVYNHNSVEGVSQKIMVYLYGMEYAEYGISAEYIGGSNQFDIAVLKISNNKIIQNANAQGVKIGNRAIIGQTAIAIGNPEAEGISVTKGIVSKLDEYIEIGSAKNTTTTLNVMRIDTAINSGNSGGGLFDANGELIGIVNAKVVATGVEGVGYALPVERVIPLVDTIIDTHTQGDPYRCVLGISVKAVSSASVYNYDRLTNDIVQKVVIAQGNDLLKEGDVLISIQKGDYIQKINSVSDVQNFVLGLRQKDKLTFNIVRNDTTISIDMVVEDTIPLD